MQDTLRLPPLRILCGVVAGFFVLGFLIYGWSLHNPFVRWDDGMLIYENPAIRHITPATLTWIFTHFDPELYIPVTFFTYQIDYLIGGIQPFQYHLDNLALHILNALLATWLLFALFKKRSLALLCGLIFLVHPMNTEAVEWASGRKDVLSAFFFLSSIISYLYYANRNRRWLYVISIVLFVLGLLSKVMIITLPVILVLMDLQQRRSIDRRVILEKIPYFALSVLFGLVGIVGKQSIIGTTTLTEKILMACKSMTFYVQQFLWPFHFALLYPFNGIISITSSFFFVPMIVICALVCCARLLWNRYRLLSFGLLFYIVTVAPTLLNFAKGEMDLYFASDRYAYLPQIGLIIVIACLMSAIGNSLEQTFRRHSILMLGCFFGVFLVCGLSLLSYRQSLVWTNTRTLFQNVISQYPDASYVAYNNLCNFDRLAGDLHTAVSECTQSLAIRPHSKTYTNIGAIYRKQKDYANAAAAYQKALELDPQSPFAHFGLGIVAAEIGKYDAAEIEYLKAIGFDPTYGDVYINLGALYAANGEYEKAVVQYKKALAIDDLSSAATYNLAVAESEMGKTDDAIADYLRAINLEPTSIAPRINVALLLYNKGESDAAAQQFRAVLKIDPQNASAISALKQMEEQ